MIFQSQIESTTRNSKQQGIIYMLLAAALILFIALFIKIPVPEPVVETPIVYMKFVSLGESETGGPAMENSSGDGGGDESAQPQNAAANEDPLNAEPDPGGGEAPKINNNPKAKSPTNTAPSTPQIDPKNAFKKSNKKGTGPLGNGPGALPGGGGNGNENKGTPDGWKDGDGYLKAEHRPAKIKQFAFSDKESDKNEIRHLWVILTVDCGGFVRKVEIARKSTDTEDFLFIKSQLKDHKYYDKRTPCNENAKWEVDVTITP